MKVCSQPRASKDTRTTVCVGSLGMSESWSWGGRRRLKLNGMSSLGLQPAVENRVRPQSSSSLTSRREKLLKEWSVYKRLSIYQRPRSYRKTFETSMRNHVNLLVSWDCIGHVNAWKCEYHAYGGGSDHENVR